MTMDEGRLRAWWWHRQGLDGSLAGQPPAAILERSGWARSVGGVGPYLTLAARGGVSREAADAAVAALAIHELPAARGCTYVVPASDFALALQVGAGFTAGDMKVAAKLGVTDQEIDKLCAAVVKAVAKAPLDPDQIRAAVGGAARSLGEAGKKKGMTTTLPLALGRLQSEGELRRVPVEGRLDQQRYRYTAWRPQPRSRLTTDQAFVELARRFFRWTGPATLAELGWFTGLGVKAAKTAAEPLGLRPIAPGHPRLALPEDLAALADFKPPRAPEYALVASFDAISALRRDLASLVDREDAARPVLRGEQRTGGNLMDLPSHAILDRGRLVGLWEYDHGRQEIVYQAFVKVDRALAAAVERTQAYVRDQLGDARSFSLDSPQSRGPRIAALAVTAGSKAAASPAGSRAGRRSTQRTTRSHS